MAGDLFRIRSALFTPATRLASLPRALDSGADLIVLDLEDGVGPGDKAAARAAVAALPGPQRARLALRISHLTTGDGLEDLLMLRTGAPWAAVMLPKVEGPAEVSIAAAHLGEALPLIALVETALGLENAAQTAAHPAVAALALGGADLAADLGVALAWEPLAAARARVVQAAAIGRCPAWDVPSLAIGDEAALAAETAAAARLGMSAKLAIHPAQVAAINRTLTPPAGAVAQARRVLAAFAAAGGGACALDGRMIDRPVALAAERLLARAHPQEDPA